VAYEYIDLAPFSEKVDVDLFAKDLRDLVAPYYGLTMRNVNLGNLLLRSSSIAAAQGLHVPTELMLYFKSLVAIEGLGKKIQRDFDFLKYSLDFAAELVKHQYDPARIAQDTNQLLRESKSFLTSLPRQMHFLLRKMASPNHQFKLKVPEIHDLKKSVEASFNLLFLGIIIGCLLISSSMIYSRELAVSAGPIQIPTLSLFGYISSGFLGIIAFINYIKK
jgi:ubiquinone biosynthesis protein